MFMKIDKARYKSGCADKNPEELSGVRKKSFLLPFAGGEIWFEHLDGIYRICPRRNNDYGRIDFRDSRCAHQARQTVYARSLCGGR